ncbi:hypothetical protein, partial [Lactiplantibacillus plantarum]
TQVPTTTQTQTVIRITTVTPIQSQIQIQMMEPILTMVVILAQMEVPVQILDQVRAIRRALLEIIQVLALVR